MFHRYLTYLLIMIRHSSLPLAETFVTAAAKLPNKQICPSCSSARNADLRGIVRHLAKPSAGPMVIGIVARSSVVSRRVIKSFFGV
jgi:hypothetical protein